MYQTKRFGLVASKQEYMMLCRAGKHMKQKKKLTGKRLPLRAKRLHCDMEHT